MAKLHEESITIKISQLVPDKQKEIRPALLQDTIDQLLAVIQELVGDNCLVEIEDNE